MIILLKEEMGCAYSIDDEGCLYYTPVYADGSIDAQDWVDVDFNSIDEDDVALAKEAQEKLISMNKINGTYYTLH